MRITTGEPKPWLFGEKNYIAKLTNKKVLWARDVVLNKKMSLTLAANTLGVSLGTLHPAIYGKTWRHVL